MLIASLLILATQDAAAAATPIDQAKWITAAQYPQGARDAGEEGTVGYVLLVDAEGKVTNCAISRPTRSWRLDTATCRILRERARFTPARDAQGRAVPGRFEGAFTWQLAR
ncbi:energy transducer TonB [Stakelama tenebrarum]|uniref:Energy transducer TonB n=1 Tax=Stakelama tenebrarum TaxID=2711215 RepID=A0A6G6Y6E6_9SPHN|nr:energy transducer TonB [Sphingosinithalassobacter tenebrarum]QIG80421.1 energy transducer TonB [Sphingosinithalassobacter tenebrarum]